ncbi:hypothetical protein VE02_09095 [Pseudogymnoascus sp. 03VT05]|nr:hypothetical protein VE02_09095 [Pseudogymnoascus sp. 03VT05]
MITPSDRFWVVGKQVKGNGPVSLIPPDEDVDIDVLKRYVGQLGQTVQSIIVDYKGLLVKLSSDPEDDRTLTTHYPRFATAPSLQNCLTVQLSQLTEEDRLGPSVDLVSYVDDSGTSKFAVFKYYMIYQTRPWIWNEPHLTKALPKHPNILPFDRVVLSDAEPRVVGFTTPYIPNGTIEQNKDRVFKLAWLKQLLDVVDYLNLNLGIVHQDIAPRNLLVDPETDNHLLFDFDHAARIGQPSCFPERNDVSGVIFTLYEIISQDEHFRLVEHREQDPDAVLILESWPLKCKLDCEVGEFRKLLDDWVRRRKCQDDAPPLKDVDFTPDLPDVPPASPIITGKDDSGEPIWGDDLIQHRKEALKLRKNVIVWERSPRQLAPIE